MRINWSCSFAKDFVSVAEGATHLCSCPLLNMWSSCHWSYWLCCCCNLHKCWRLWFHAFVLLLQEEDCGFDLFEICGSLTVSPLTLRRWCCTFSKTNSRNLTNIWNNNQFSSISEISKCSRCPAGKQTMWFFCWVNVDAELFLYCETCQKTLPTVFLTEFISTHLEVCRVGV